MAKKKTRLEGIKESLDKISKGQKAHLTDASVLIIQKLKAQCQIEVKPQQA